ncbi:MAG: class I SAM-dependent methyltransferase [Bacteroidales bacterium]|nr:class I SAM-dependent methyltransferase [Bacteroidales bacterium]
MSLKTKFFGNTRKPRGLFGIYMVNRMNGGHHAVLAEWALKDFEIDSESSALDIGCGGGANIARLLERCRQVTGVDYSSVAVSKARKFNWKAIAQGRCNVVEGNVADLPFEDDSFNLVTAFETIYFWPDIEDCYRQVRRVLKDGGRFVIVNELDGERDDKKWETIIEGMHAYTPDEIESGLNAAGFTSIELTRDDRHFVRVVAEK